MTSSNPTVRHHVARVAALSRDRKSDDPELVGARRDLAAINLEEYVTKVVAGWPSLTEAQLDRVAALLRP